MHYQNLGEAIAWLTRVFGFKEYYRYGDGPSGGQKWAGNAAIQVRQARDGQKSPAQLGYGTQSLTIFVDDVDAHYARAKAAEAKILEEPMRPSTANISTPLPISMATTGCSPGTPGIAAPKSGAEW